ncbi:MAG: hypothetical protein ACRBEQ_00310 [Hyphomonas sp.]
MSNKYPNLQARQKRFTANIPRSYQLSSGVFIQQDLFQATRFVVFDTDYPEYPVATHGGTLLLIRRNNRLFGLTTLHGFGKGDEQFPFHNLKVHSRHSEPIGEKLKLKTLKFPDLSAPRFEEISELGDLVIVEYVDFQWSDIEAFVWDTNTFCGARKTDRVIVVGYLKDRSTIDTDDHGHFSIGTQPCRIDLDFIGWLSDNDVMQSAQMRLPDDATSEIGNLSGLSGAPIFNHTQNGVCGMVIRAGISQDNLANVHFLNAQLIDYLLEKFDDDTLDLKIVTSSPTA